MTIVCASLARLLKQYGACEEAVEWAAPYNDLVSAWAACSRGDWMLWLAAKAELCSRQQLVLAACECARLALPYVPEHQPRPLHTIETAEGWARGETALEEVMAAYAYDAAAYAAAAYAATAAAYAAAAAVVSVAVAAASAAYAPGYAAYAAGSAASAASAPTTLATCADIIRRRASAENWVRLLDLSR